MKTTLLSPGDDGDDDKRREAAEIAKRLLDIPYCPNKPTDKQAEFLLYFGQEAMYGGAAGGGKSDALLMAALQFVDVPGYAALILRKSFTDLAQPGALMDRANDWWGGLKGVKFSAMKNQYTFPSGAKIQFGYLQRDQDKDRYKSAEFQYIAFDELTEHELKHYRFLFSRLRRPKNSKGALSKVPLRMRSATNPGGPGHEWVKDRFIEPKEHKPNRRFFPAFLTDNPYIDAETYRQSLAELDITSIRQLEEGDWSAMASGETIKREWFPIIDEVPPKIQKWVRYWDLAATEDEQQPGQDPDWTVGCLAARTTDNRFVVKDLRRFRRGPADVEELVQQQATIDGKEVEIWFEQEPGSGSKSLISHYQRNVLAGYTVHPHPKIKDKVTAASPWAALARNQGFVLLVRHANLQAFLDEVDGFPSGRHDDMVDAVSGAYHALFGKKEGPVRVSSPRKVQRTVQRRHGRAA